MAGTFINLSVYIFMKSFINEYTHAYSVGYR